MIQVYINGRELMKHTFEENAITYKMYDNSFYKISNIGKAQELADKFDSKSLCRQLDFFAHKVNPYLDTVEQILHNGYHWCVTQCEYATDVMFKSRDLWGIFIHPWSITTTHELIRKIPHSRKYLVSKKGHRVMGALIEAKRKTYSELAAS